ncbi:type I restriction endonuclease subunit R [Campylobacter sp. JMF_02 ED1]|uniref:type I restriction endonuclease subunit R n=1 Tax=unclassified Campylobacter TaxID=2593542 RepID=UPI0022E9DF63|nr:MULTISPECIES: type I restriction endonuclease subunit R [unclassified Campylobacter]MDA3049313.1 type I restriction endonuclease subunit R [Campylobacter sp. JMF_15 NE4]MDA3051262.1 type I restriction endonuclease subunit R [Campylobacter sp. JMF_02 ED1]
MANFISEDDIEKSAIDLLVSKHGYKKINCFTEVSDKLPDNSGRTDKKQVILPEILFECLIRLNPEIPNETIKSEWEKLCVTPFSREIMGENYSRYAWLKNGIKVEFDKNGKKESKILKIVDFKNPQNNDFCVVSQMWIRGESYFRRPDLIIFINGLPLVFIELKNSNVAVKNAYDDNLKNYLRDIPQLFYYNQICVLSNGLETRLGSFGAGYHFFFEWLKVQSENESVDRDSIKAGGISLEYFINGLCKPENLIDYIENFILFDRKQNKIIAKNHQFFGVNNAFASFLDRESKNGKLGVFWHTQGSGKSYSMVMLVAKINRKVGGNYTFLVVTDRKDLDEQIYKNFLRTGFISDNEKVRPKNSKALRDELKTNKKILFTLIHKFGYDKGKTYPILSERDDIVVIVDEAHRTQYKDLAENMRKGLPNAGYFAFTGTPLLGSKRLTNQYFGDYVSEYNFADSIADNATVPLFYVKRVPEMCLENDFFNDEFAEILEDENLSEEEQIRLERHYAKELEVIKRDDRLEVVAKYIVEHFPYRGFRGKGMVVSVDKFTAVKMYDKVQRYWQDEIKKLRRKISEETNIDEKARLKDIVDYMRSVEMAVVISTDGSDEEERKFNAEHLSIRAHIKRMEEVDENGYDIEDNFKDHNHPLQLVFVCAMWLTGFDAPSVSTIYLDKPMKNHTLMQTIARANRVFENKSCGLIIDHINVFKHLKKALVDYAGGDSVDMPVKEIDVLFDKLNECIEMTIKFCNLHGVDLTQIVEDDDTFAELEKFQDFADKIIANDEVKNEFKALANTVENIYESLKPEIFNMIFDQKPYKEAILYLRDIIAGYVRPEKIESAMEKINKLLDESVVATDNAKKYIINTDGRELDLSVVDIDELRKEFKKVTHKNLAIADLRKLIEDKLAIMVKKNVTRTKFAEKFKEIIDEYNAGGSENEDFYEKLLDLMQELKDEENRHIKEDLSEEELEIFDLLCKEKLSKEEEKKVKLAAKNLYQTLIENKYELFVVDWWKDPQPKAVVKNKIISVLDSDLPDSYDRTTFQIKSDLVFEHIVERANMGYGWIVA